MEVENQHQDDIFIFPINRLTDAPSPFRDKNKAHAMTLYFNFIILSFSSDRVYHGQA